MKHITFLLSYSVLYLTLTGILAAVWHYGPWKQPYWRAFFEWLCMLPVGFCIFLLSALYMISMFGGKIDMSISSPYHISVFIAPRR